MPKKKSKNDLPEAVKNSLPPHGQKIFLEAYNNAWDEYKNPERRKGDTGREEAAMKVAWSAVKSKYKKKDQGEWVKK